MIQSNHLENRNQSRRRNGKDSETGKKNTKEKRAAKQRADQTIYRRKKVYSQGKN